MVFRKKYYKNIKKKTKKNYLKKKLRNIFKNPKIMLIFEKILKKKIKLAGFYNFFVFF